MGDLATFRESCGQLADLSASQKPLGLRDISRAVVLVDDAREALEGLREKADRGKAQKNIDELRGILSLESERAAVSLVQPHSTSASVALIYVGGEAQAVIKVRGYSPDKPRREETTYRLAAELGLDEVVSPCVTVPLSLVEETTGVRGAIAGLIRDFYRANNEAVPPLEYCTVERFVSVKAPLNTLGGPLSHRLANQKGFCDLAAAYQATQSGVEEHGVASLRTSAMTLPDDDFVELLARLDQRSVEKLVVLSILVQQRDGCGVNVLLRGTNDGFALVSTDNTRTFGTLTGSELKISFEDDDTRYGSYWYPAVLALPGSLQPLSSGLRDEIKRWDAQQVEDLVLSNLLVNGRPSPADAKSCALRVRLVQDIIARHSTISLRELAFQVVPSWKTDWDDAVDGGDLGPLPVLLSLAKDEEPLEDWSRRQRLKRWGKRAAKVGAVLGLLWLLREGRRRL